MANNNLRFNIVLSADGSRVVGAVDQASNSFQRLDGDIGRASQSSSLLSDTFITLRRNIMAAGAGYAAFRAAHNLSNQVAQVQDLDTRIKNLTGSQERATQVNRFLVDVARDHNQELLGLTDTYSTILALERSRLITGKQSEQLLVGFSNVTKAYGASTDELKLTLKGLQQGLSRGVLQAEEFAQVIDPMPGLLYDLEKAAGVAGGGFKKLVDEQRVTSDFMINVLLKAFQSYEGVAASTGDNLSAKYAQIATSYTLLAKTLEEPINSSLSGVLDTTNDALVWVNENYETLANGSIILAGAIGGRLTAALVTSTKAKYASIIATRARIATELQSAQAAVASSARELASARVAQVYYRQRITFANMHSAAQDRLTAATARLTAAEVANRAASRGLTTATASARRSTGLLGRTMGILGGTGGIITTVVGGLWALSSVLGDNKTKTDELSTSLKEYTATKIRDLKSEELTELYTKRNAAFEQISQNKFLIKDRESGGRKPGQNNAETIKKFKKEIEEQKKLVVEIDKSIDEVNEIINKNSVNLPKSNNDEDNNPIVIPAPVVSAEDQAKSIANLEYQMATEERRIKLSYQRRVDIIEAGNLEATRKKQLLDRAKTIRDDELAKPLERLQEQLAGEEERIQISYRTRVAIIKKHTKEGDDTRTELMRKAQAIREREISEFNKREAAADKKHTDSMNLQNEKILNNKVNTAAAIGSTFGNIADLYKEGNRNEFETYKRFAQAQAGISAALAVLQVYSDKNLPTYAKFALSASIGTLAAVQVHKIEQQDYQGGNHGGATFIPNDTTVQVQRGERIISQRQNLDLTTLLVRERQEQESQNQTSKQPQYAQTSQQPTQNIINHHHNNTNTYNGEDGLQTYLKNRKIINNIQRRDAKRALGQ